MTAPGAVLVLGLEDWELWQHAQRLSVNTISERVRVLAQFHAETGVQPVRAAPIDIVRWIAGHDADWSDSTAATYRSYLAAWFKWLQITDRRTDDPMIKVGRVKVPERVPRPIADVDVPKLLSARMWSSTRAMILLALLAGLRVHEIAKVRGEDVDLAARLLWVKGKGRRLKSVPLHPLLIELAATMPATGWWFPMRGYPSERIEQVSLRHRWPHDAPGRGGWHAAQSAALVCHEPARRRQRFANSAGIVAPQVNSIDPDLHACLRQSAA